MGSSPISRRYAEVAELADAHGSGPCGSNTLRVRLPSSALVKEKPYGFLFLKKRLAITCDTRQGRAFLKKNEFSKQLRKFELIEKLLDKPKNLVYNTYVFAQKWRTWQTRTVQVRVVAIP